jgi:hypothetical protein
MLMQDGARLEGRASRSSISEREGLRAWDSAMKILRVLLVVSAVVMICGISGQAMLWHTSSSVKTAQYPNAFGLKFKGVKEPTLYIISRTSRPRATESTRC